jgi:hypothetical protein
LPSSTKRTIENAPDEFRRPYPDTFDRSVAADVLLRKEPDEEEDEEDDDERDDQEDEEHDAGYSE